MAEEESRHVRRLLRAAMIIKQNKANSGIPNSICGGAAPIYPELAEDPGKIACMLGLKGFGSPHDS